MRIGVDLDDVLGDCSINFANYYNDAYHANVDANNITSFGSWQGESKEEWLKVVTDFFNSDHFKQLKPIPGATEALSVLKKHGCYLAVITSRPRTTEQTTSDWLSTHFGSTFDVVQFAGHRLGTDTVTKREICLSQAIELMIEDAPVHAKECLEACNRVLLYDQPWNQEVKDSGRLTRVFNWNQIVEIIDLYDKK